MNNNPRKILIVFSNYADKALLKEVCMQMDRKIRIDFAGSEPDIAAYLSRNRMKSLPGLIVFDNPPMRVGLAEFVDSFRRDGLYAAIPIAFLLGPADIPIMKKWMRGELFYFFPKPAMPSECKMYVRQMLDAYHEPAVARV